MLMMRLQRVGRKNDPSYRIVVVDKRTGPKSNKHIDHLGSYNPKLSLIQLDKEKAADWLSKGVQASDTMHNILVSQGVIDAKKRNPLPKKTPVVNEAKLKAEAEAKEAKEKAEADAKAATEAEKAEAEKPAETEEVVEETPAEAEETKEEVKE
jgi:small subunit ribosomal protein S16